MELIHLPALAHLVSFLFPTAFVCALLRPTSVADSSVAQLLTVLQDTVRQSDYWQSVARRFTLAYRSAYSGATRDSASPPEVTHCSSVPCRPQAPWCGG